MFKFGVFIFCVLLIGSSFGAREGFGPGLQDWGFADVREGAHMFWWLYYTTAKVASHTERPLVIWLQGGPGASSTGYGNFEELGPLDLDLNERNHSWVREMNVLFIDNPVGSGFSYVDDKKYLTTDNAQIASDLVELMRIFYKEIPEFKNVPLHIFSESYGGKMAAEFAYLLNKEIKEGTIECDLQSVALGDSWISPIDSVLSWASFLLNMGAVDQDGYKNVMASALETQKSILNGEFLEATDWWGYTEMVILKETHGIDFYNVLLPTSFYNKAAKIEFLKKMPGPKNHKLKSDLILRSMYETLVNYDDRDRLLEKLMNGLVHTKLEIPKHVKWGSQSSQTFMKLSEDFMKPVTDVVELLLNRTTIEVIVFTGQLDLIVATPGTVEWINRLKWPGQKGYINAPRNGISVNNILEGYSKKYDKFSVYWVNRAGHMVPNDNPAAMGKILRDVTNFG